MSKRKAAEVPLAHQSVVGTFQAGKKHHYLVLSVFGEFAWWGRVVALEFLGLRGKDKAAIDKFHAKPKKKTERAWVNQEKRFPNIKWVCNVAASETKGIDRFDVEMPTLLDLEVHSLPKKGWEDLLRLEADNREIKKVDDEVIQKKSFGELLEWAYFYARNRWRASSAKDWAQPLDKAMQANEDGYIVSARVLRYGFRRMGFPTRIVALDTKQPIYPLLGVQIYIPTWNLTWTIFPGSETHSVFKSTNVSMETFQV